MACVVYINNKMVHSTPPATPDSLKSTLVDLAKYRDKQLFIQLYDHFAPRLKSHLMQKAVSEPMAEELVQECMLSVWRHCGSYNPDKATASTWIFRIARNLWIDRLRKDKPDRISSLDSYPDMPFTPEMSQMDSGALRSALKKLPPQQAQLVYQVYYAGKTHREISDEMDIPLGSVKSGLRLALNKLRNQVGDDL